VRRGRAGRGAPGARADVVRIARSGVGPVAIPRLQALLLQDDGCNRNRDAGMGRSGRCCEEVKTIGSGDPVGSTARGAETGLARHQSQDAAQGLLVMQRTSALRVGGGVEKGRAGGLAAVAQAGVSCRQDAIR